MENERSLEEWKAICTIRPFHTSQTELQKAYRENRSIIWTINPSTLEIRIAIRNKGGRNYVYHENMDRNASNSDYGGYIDNKKFKFTREDYTVPLSILEKIILEYLNQ